MAAEHARLCGKANGASSTSKALQMRESLCGGAEGGTFGAAPRREVLQTHRVRCALRPVAREIVPKRTVAPDDDLLIPGDRRSKIAAELSPRIADARIMEVLGNRNGMSRAKLGIEDGVVQG